jgi:molybdopterin-containing oxidoreductase family iron-sulfur binding subunit
MSKSKRSRREFVLSGLALGGMAASSGVLANCAKEDPADEEETIQLLSQDGQLVEVPKSQITATVPDTSAITNKEAREGIKGKKFVMVVDLARCKNELKCQSACNKMHFLPEDRSFIKVKKMQDAENTAPYWQPTLCLHCDEPPCVKVCPVDATFKRRDGIVLIDNERCIGCRFCMAACPYTARVFNWSEPELPLETLEKEYSPESSVPAKCGTVEKCDFCPHSIRKGELPECVSACPNGVFYFGDLNEDTVTNGDETVRFSELIRDRAGYRLMEDLGTKPSVYYLPPSDRLFPFEEPQTDNSEES